jgi:vitamin B12 transporter
VYKRQRWFNTYQLQPQTNLNFGAEYSDEKFSGIGDDAYEVKRQSAGYFAGAMHQFERLTIQANMRRDNVNVDNTAWGQTQSNESSATTGLVGLGYQLIPNWKLTSSVSTGFRAPAAAEISTSPFLKPEKHQSKEVGVVYSTSQTLARMTYFESSTTDAITWAYTGNGWCTQNCYENVAKTSNQGFEGAVRSQWMGYNVNLSLTTQNPVNDVTGKPLSLRARHYGSFDISRPVGSYELGSKIYASGARPNAGPLGGGYALVSFYASRKMDHEWTARVKLENAFDREYQLIKGYNTPGRSIYATLQYQPK